MLRLGTIVRRLVPAVLALAAFLAASPARAGDIEERRAQVRDALKQLASPDEAVRRKAAALLVERSLWGSVEIARHGADLDERAWKTVSDAFIADRCRGVAGEFVAAAHTAPEAHRRRLLALARALDPEAGVERTPEQVASRVAEVLEAAHHARCSTGYYSDITILGHAAVEPLLETIRKAPADHEGDHTACEALGALAEREDVQAIREQFLAGRGNLTFALGCMQERGVPGATEALLDAIAAGDLDSRVTRALQGASDRARVLKAVDGWIAQAAEVSDDQREELARLFAALGAREKAPTLVAWIPTTRRPGAFTAIAHALVGFGNPDGVGLLVRIVGEARTRFPCRPSNAEEEAAASAPDRLCPEGFHSYDRDRAAKALTGIAGKGVFDYPEEERRARGKRGDDCLDRAAAAYRKWWDASKDRLRYDPAAGRWVVGE